MFYYYHVVSESTDMVIYDTYILTREKFNLYCPSNRVTLILSNEGNTRLVSYT